MDFFKSILSDDTEPENMDDHGNSEVDRRPNQSPKHQEIGRAEEEFTNLNLTSNGEDVGAGGGAPVAAGGGGGGLWSFGDLVKTLTTRSESVLETYRRDLKEFGSGLRKESDLFREVASRAVKELPSSIEVGASAIDGVLKSTADIISQGKEALLEPSDFDDSDASESVQNRSLNTRGYSRFDSQLNAIQSDARTYCVDPEDLDDYSNWKSGFLLDDKETEIEKLIGENGSIDAIYRKVVPNEVDDGSFWCRYFYRVHKLKQQEDMRANLVRSLTADDEEELSWDIDEDEEEEEQQADQVKSNASNINDSSQIETKQTPNHESKTVTSNIADDDDHVAIVNKNNIEDQKVESVPKSDEHLDLRQTSGTDGVDDDLEKNTDAAASADKNNADDSKVESVPKTNENRGSSTPEEDDIEWDEIEDLGENDEKKVSQSDITKNGDLFKQLNAAEDDDEDLSWDIEDDDEPVKASNNK